MKMSQLWLIVSYIYLAQAITIPWVALGFGIFFMIFSFILNSKGE